MAIYRTSEWNGHGKQNYYSNEYRREGNEVAQYRCHRYKHFDGHESEWLTDEKRMASWSVNDPSMPSWLRKYI